MTKTEESHIESELFPDGTKFEDLGKQLLLEEYKLFVETSETVVARRQVANTFFLSANSALLAALGVLSQTTLAPVVARLAFSGIGVAWLLLCTDWRFF